MKSLLILLFAVPALAVNVKPSMTTRQIQSALNSAPAGSTISFAAGNYSITAPLVMPCANLQMTGPVASPASAVLSATYVNNVILSYPGNCAKLGSVQYLGFVNTGAIYFGVGNNGNFTFAHNQVSKLPSNLSNDSSEAGLFFDGNLNTTLSNITVQYNTFGDASSCTAVFATGTDMGGYCAGIITSQGVDNNLTITNNQFVHVEEGIHLNQMSDWNPGGKGSVCISCTIEYNTVINYHRIGIEIQTGTPTNPISVQHNAVLDPLNSSYGTFAVSLACCQWSNTMGTTGFSPGIVFNDNVLVASTPCGAKCPPYGVEFWGTGSQGLNSLVQGSFSNGYTWGHGAGNWAINNNYICGPNYTSQGGYISNQQNQSNPPAQKGNTTGRTCHTTPSGTPSIAPAGGTYQTPQTVTLTVAAANTRIWYTLDGSTPVPGQAKLYAVPFTLSASATVKAVGMWGAQNQPTRYPAGYGYVPSAVVSAAYVIGTSPTKPVAPTMTTSLVAASSGSTPNRRFFEHGHPGQRIQTRKKVAVSCVICGESNPRGTLFLDGNGGFNCHACGAKAAFRSAACSSGVSARPTSSSGSIDKLSCDVLLCRCLSPKPDDGEALSLNPLSFVSQLRTRRVNVENHPRSGAPHLLREFCESGRVLSVALDA